MSNHIDRLEQWIVTRMYRQCEIYVNDMEHGSVILVLGRKSQSITGPWLVQSLYRGQVECIASRLSH